MNKCLYCGKELTKKTVWQKYCSKKCCWRYRDKPKENHEQKEKRNKLIKQDRLNGMSMSECAIKYGLSEGGIHHICEQVNTLGIRSNRKAKPITWKDKTEEERTKRANEYISRYTKEIYYVSGWINAESYCRVKHIGCNHEYDMSMSSVRNYRGLPCHVCDEILKQERKRIIGIQKETYKNYMETNKEYRYVIKNIERGLSRITKKPKHTKEERESIQTQLKYAKQFNATIIDKDICWQTLYKESNQCAICRELIDTEDYRIVNGNKICGNNYPSIDHIIPLSKGGNHSWDNVRLVHRLCNSNRQCQRNDQ